MIPKNIPGVFTHTLHSLEFTHTLYFSSHSQRLLEINTLSMSLIVHSLLLLLALPSNGDCTSIYRGFLQCEYTAFFWLAGRVFSASLLAYNRP